MRILFLSILFSFACSTPPNAPSQNDDPLAFGSGQPLFTGNTNAIPESPGSDLDASGDFPADGSAQDASSSEDGSSDGEQSISDATDGSGFSEGGEAGDGDTGVDAEPDGSSDDNWTVEVPEEGCVFLPEPGVFQPVMECYWSDPPEFAKYDDVVMTPIVVNVTDDNMDGVIDLSDTPDVIFSSYRYQEDGCCASPSVLRIVSGSCNAGEVAWTGQDKRLFEHVAIGGYAIDNSAGLAAADLDGDGAIEIVSLLAPNGSVAFTGVIYPEQLPLSELASEGWAFSGAPSLVEAVSNKDGDLSVATVTQSGKTLLLQAGSLQPVPEALATLRVVATVRNGGMLSKVSGVLKRGADELTTTAQLVSSEEFQTIRFDFPRYAFEGEDRPWTIEDLAEIGFGIRNQTEQEVSLVVTQVSLEVGAVYKKWESEYPLAADMKTGAQPSIVDLNADGVGEVLVGRTLIDGVTGALLWVGDAGTGANGIVGPVSFGADLDLDGLSEVVAGDTLYSSEGAVLWQVDYGSEPSNCKSGNVTSDGYNAIGNFDDDPEGEIATVRCGVFFLVNHLGQIEAEITIPKDNCSKNEGGPPTISDFDGDGDVEVGVAGADYYVVVDLECCVDPMDCTQIPDGLQEVCSDPGIRWKVENKDCSSRVTGSSVFDFDGDGAAEVVYNDEEQFRIFSGVDGTELFSEPNISHTRMEYPIIVDADRDGNAEIVFVENKNGSTPLQIWGDPSDNWVPTRSIWNQHAYHISHVTELGQLPEPGSQVSWLGHNTFRQNLPDFDPFSAPDLSAEWMDPEVTSCPQSLALKGAVCNQGTLWASGVDLRFFRQDTGAEIFCVGGVQMDKTLDSGECTLATCVVEDMDLLAGNTDLVLCVDGFTKECTGPGWHNECNEENNKSVSPAPSCQP